MMWNTILTMAIGGLISSLSGIAAIYFQAASTRRKRMDEIMAEKKIEADAQAYRDMKFLESMLIRDTPSLEIIGWMQGREEWFFSNRLFLPGKFPAQWLLTRNNLLAICEKSKSGGPALGKALRGIVLITVREAIDEIYKDTKQKRIILDDINMGESESGPDMST